MAKTLIYSCAFQVEGSDKLLTGKVQVIEGYSTFGDIPKIFAITRGVGASEVTIVTASLVAERDAPE